MDLHFKFIDDFCDIADEKNRIYIEVKLDHFAPAQLLLAIAKKGIKEQVAICQARIGYWNYVSIPSQIEKEKERLLSREE